MIRTKRLTALFAVAALAACDCRPIRRTDVPTGDAYRDQLQRVERFAGTLDIRLPFNRLKRDSSESLTFERLGFVRFAGARATPIGAWAHRVVPGVDAIDDAIDVPIGHQQIDALTYAERDEPACATYGSAQDDMGYRAHVDRLNATGRALLAAHLLSIGFANDARPWDGRSHLVGVLSLAAHDDSAEPIHVERGEQIQLTSSFEPPSSRRAMTF